MITLGLDPSLTGFGWCVHDSQAMGQKRVLAKGVHKTFSTTCFVERYVECRELVEALLKTFTHVEAVGVESPPFGELFSEGLYGLFLMVNEAIYTQRKDVIHFDPSTVKMLAKQDPTLRKGKMFKQDMVDVAKQETGISRFNHNEADAYLIAKYAARFFQLFHGVITEEDLMPSEKRAFVRKDVLTKGSKKGIVVLKGALFKEDKRFFRFSQLESYQNGSKEKRRFGFERGNE